jgi:hypothetical protein
LSVPLKELFSTNEYGYTNFELYWVNRFLKQIFESEDPYTDKELKNLIMEELTKSDKDEIKKIVSKEVESLLKSKSTKDMIVDEIEKHMRSKDAKEQVGEIAKKVLKKLYKDLSLQHPYIIDRIKV